VRFLERQEAAHLHRCACFDFDTDQCATLIFDLNSCPKRSANRGRPSSAYASVRLKMV
jgi:hypothetical protein